MKSQKLRLLNFNKSGWDGMGHVEEKVVIVYATEEERQSKVRQFLEYWQDILTAHCETDNMAEGIRGNFSVQCGPEHED